MSATPMEAVGQLLSGTYQIERKIAAGGMGVVYEASHVRLPRRFAIKVLGRPSEGADADVALERFKREAQVASALKNPHVVQIYDYQIAEGGFPYIVMELLEGEDLSHRIKREAPLPPALAVRIVSQIAEALDAAHAIGVIHRDLKPANVFLNRTPEPEFVKVLDFGVSKMASWVTITRTDALVGTPLYMSPEQAGGSGDMTHVSDVFSLGAIAYELLTGTRAFAAKSIPAILYQVVHADPAPVSQALPPEARDVDAVFAQVLAKDRRLRYPSAGRFARALELALAPILPPSRPAAGADVEVSSERTRIHLEGRAASASAASLTGPPTPVQAPLAAPPRPVDAFSEPTRLEGARRAAPVAVAYGEPTRLGTATPLRPPPSVTGKGPSAAWAKLAARRAAGRADVGRLVLIGAGIVVLATATTIGFRRGRSERGARAVAPASAAETPRPSDPPGPPAPPHDVRITVHATPAAAAIFLDGEPLPDGGVTVRWRSEPRHLSVSAPGYTATERAVDATSDRVVEVTLVPLLAPPPRTPSRRSSRTPARSDPKRAPARGPFGPR